MIDYMHRSLRWGAALAAGAVAGYVCMLLHTPIPWMLGPLFALALLRIAGVDVAAPPPARYLGQWIIGTSLGLYFTPEVVRLVAGYWWLLAIGAVFAIVLGYVSGIALARLANLDKTTGIFASVPGGATEMATLGERFGGRMDRIAAAQSLRILIVVALVPGAITALGIHGADPFVQGAKVFSAGGFALLLAATFAGSLLFQWLKMPNAFVLGSLAVAIPLTAAQIDLSSLPSLASNVGQWLLGCALGSRFQPDFLRGAHRFVGAVAMTVVLSIILSAVFGASLAWAVDLHPATLVLGNAPGGIAEMCITAKVLQLGVPLVTAFHVTRLVVLLLATPLVFVRARQWYRGRPR
ncbi:MAG: AbrB family transcriptional regulator [Burkholderiales bacterium]|nr:AbrB family transcriptional regulator [Burkholderiales bacterium]